jgi:hypothetical protein
MAAVAMARVIATVVYDRERISSEILSPLLEDIWDIGPAAAEQIVVHGQQAAPRGLSVQTSPGAATKSMRAMLT